MTVSFTQEPVFIWLSQYAYEPTMVYLGVFGMMILSGFGLPVPEEVTLVSLGILTYMGAHPELFPPPYPNAPVIDGYEAAIITLLAVISTDILVFSLGRIFGRRIIQLPRLKPLFSGKVMGRINHFVKKYGILAAFVFRFTPGLRFPAHVFLGMSPFALWQFLIVDGLAASISVPSQILLLYHYGEPILHLIHKFKVGIFSTLCAIAVLALVHRLWKTYGSSSPSGSSDGFSRSSTPPSSSHKDSSTFPHSTQSDDQNRSKV